MYPPEIACFVGAREPVRDSVGCSSAEVLIYEDCVLKIERDSEESSNERCMTRWLHGRLPVPQVLASCCVEGNSYLLTSRLQGKMAYEAPYIHDPDQLVQLLAQALQMVWRVDPSGAPAGLTLDEKLHLAQVRIDADIIDLEACDPDTFGPDGFSNPQALLNYLKANRPKEDLVFTHGDFCLPNVFFRGGQVEGIIDFGRCGVSDRWQDISLCMRSLAYNLGTDRYNEALLDALGLWPDEEKRRYYLLLDELF